MRRLAITILIGFVLLAGCLGGEDDASTGEGEMGDEELEETSRNAENGGQGDGATGDASPSGAENATRAESFELQAEGELPPGAYLVVGGFQAPALAEEDRWHLFELEGTVEELTVKMDWEPVDPTATTLSMGLGPREDTDASGWQATDEYESVAGEPPLEMSLSDLSWDKGKYVVWAWWDSGQTVQPTPRGQPVTWEGTIQHSVQT